MRSNRRLSSPALYSRQTNETWKGQEAETIIKRKKFLKSTSALNVFHSSYIPGPETEVCASTRANLPTAKGRLSQNDKTDINAIQESPGSEIENDASITFSMDDSLCSEVASSKPSFEKAESEVEFKEGESN